MLTGSIGYTHELTEYVVEHAKEAPAVADQLASPEVDIFTGLPFQESTGELSNEEKQTELKDYIAQADESRKAEIYTQIMSIPSEEQMEASLQQALAQTSRDELKASMVQGLTEQMGMSEEEVQTYIDEMDDEELDTLIEQMMRESIQQQYAAQVQQQLAGMSAGQLAAALDQSLTGYTAEQCAAYL